MPAIIIIVLFYFWLVSHIPPLIFSAELIVLGSFCFLLQVSTDCSAMDQTLNGIHTDSIEIKGRCSCSF